MTYEFEWIEDAGDENILFGELSDGRFFLAYSVDDYDRAVWFFDEDPYDYVFGEDCDSIEDAVEVYSTGELVPPQSYKFWRDALKFYREE